MTKLHFQFTEFNYKKNPFINPFSIKAFYIKYLYEENFSLQEWQEN